VPGETDEPAAEISTPAAGGDAARLAAHPALR
jgi:hypothetical protein